MTRRIVLIDNTAGEDGSFEVYIVIERDNAVLANDPMMVSLTLDGAANATEPQFKRQVELKLYDSTVADTTEPQGGKVKQVGPFEDQPVAGEVRNETIQSELTDPVPPGSNWIQNTSRWRSQPFRN